MPVGPPQKQLRWGRVILVLVLFAGIVAAAIVLATR
jgi:hypothetical protein